MCVSARRLPPSGSPSPVLIIGLITGYEVHLGLDEVQTVLLILTLFVSGLTFGGVRTNVLQGTVHILLFIVYVALIFSP